MRPELSRLCGATRTSFVPRRAAGILFLIFMYSCVCCLPAGAQQVNAQLRFGGLMPLSIDQVRDAAVLAIPSLGLGFDSKLLKVTRRPDLEDLLSFIVKVKGIRGLYLYQVEVPSQASFDGQWTWIVAAVARKQEAYDLYSFESAGKRVDITGEFNRFATKLSLSLSKDDLAIFAAFFLETAIPIRPGELVLDQDALRDAVGRQYYVAYDQAWRSIDAYTQLWARFLDGQNVPELAPRAEIEPDGCFRVTLSRVVTAEGAHPQLQQWRMEISPQGNVRAVAMQTIFPKAPRWMFYDSPQQPSVAAIGP